MKKPSVQRLLKLQELWLQYGRIKRRIWLPPDFAQENDIEHSYTLAMTAWFLSEYFPNLNRDKLIRLALARLSQPAAGNPRI